VTSSEEIVDAGNDNYRDNHLSKMFRDGFSFSGYERDGLFLSRGDRTFLNVSGISGLDSPSDGRGSVFADFDNDGDLDIFVTTIQGQAHLLFRNNVGSEKNFLRVQLVGTESGADAFGAEVRVKTSQGIQTKIKSGGAGYLSQHDPRLLFGLGDGETFEWMEVTWPSGKKDRFETVAVGSSWKLVEGGTLTPQADEVASLPEPWTQSDRLLSDLKVSIGQPFPKFAIGGLDGQTSQTTQLFESGQRTILNLWATWCVPCATEMPELQARRAEFAASGVQLVGLNIDTRSVGKVPGFLEEKGIDYPIYLAGDAIPEIYDTDQVFVPLTFLIDEEGIVRDAFGGWTGQTRTRVERFLR